MDSRTALVLYHYLYPDDVVSAIHLGELCQGLAAAGWQVTARPSNRGCREESRRYTLSQDWGGVKIRRVWRPRFRQASTRGRLLNIGWMLTAWSLCAFLPGKGPDVLIVGTDPILSVLVARVWRTIRPRTKIVHWCFDLYPDAAFADGLLKQTAPLARMLTAMLRSAYKACDLIVDIGSCMRDLIARYGSKAKQATLVPWALEEPARALPTADKERVAVFGATALALMYSGSYGRAHTCSEVLGLARSLRKAGASLAFSARGNRVHQLKGAITTEDTNIHFVPFAPADRLQDRLAAADIHVVSLREEWTGTVVPSKFFGALAIGRPVLFFGSEQSSIAEWIEKHRIGWVWCRERASEIEMELRSLMAQPDRMLALRQHCHDVYTQFFAKDRVIAGWDQELRELLTMPVRDFAKSLFPAVD